MIESRLVIGRLLLRNLAADKISQYCVDQSCVFGSAQQSRRLDSHGDRRMIGNAGIAKLEEADDEQGLDDAVAFLEGPVQ